MTVSEETGHQEEISIEISEMIGQEKCIRLHVLTVVKNVKFPSNQLKAELFYVKIASEQRKAIVKKTNSKIKLG